MGEPQRLTITERVERRLKMEEHRTDGNTSELACPWCGAINKDMYEVAPAGDGDSCEFWCGECEKPIRVVARYSYDLIGYRGEVGA